MFRDYYCLDLLQIQASSYIDVHEYIAKPCTYKIYHLNITGDQLKYYWSDETPESKWDDPIPDGVDPWNLGGRGV